jgi:mannose-6-phosphate isomerase
VRPLLLQPNLPDTFYVGSGRIAQFRDTTFDAHPEDWVGSATPRFGLAPAGITRLPDDTLLTDAIASDPEGWLGRDHVARHGANPALLVKLLDAGQRLPMHVHPDRRFAAAHLASPYGKTEAWIVLDAKSDAVVQLGFKRDVEADELAGWVQRQDIDTLLSVTNTVPIAAGDTVLCPAGMPHAIGEGILLVELQEPTDFSVMLEWRGFPLSPADATLGLSFDEALACVDRTACSAERLAALRGRPVEGAGPLLPDEAAPFFIADRITAASGALGASFAIVVVTAGSGTLSTELGDKIPVSRGSTVLTPHSAGRVRLSGDVAAIRCRPS